MLEKVFAHHELGSVPPTHADFLRNIATSHQLGVVLNLWSKPEPWLEVLRVSGILAVFKTLVFSSDGPSIKPSPVLFERAASAFPAHSSILFVGDSLDRDIIPAKALGFSTAWLAPVGAQHAAALVPEARYG